MVSGIRCVLGTMTFSGQTSKQEAETMIEKFVSAGYRELDSARMYERGNTEKMLGDILGGSREEVSIASKANPFGTHNKSLSRESVESQLAESLEDVRGPIDIYYLHSPDPRTPVAETLEAVDAAHKAGKFKEFGLSNYQSWEVAHICAVCRERGFVVPTVYQGMYNLATREVERELLPCLRALGLRFYAYNPLMGGLLTGKHRRESLAEDPEGRFRASNTMYRERYLKDTQLDAVEDFVKACSDAQIEPAKAAIQWLVHHSKLVEGDGVIIGASKVSHFDQNLEAMRDPPLPESVVKACDKGWAHIKAAGACPSYERGYSKYE